MSKTGSFLCLASFLFGAGSLFAQNKIHVNQLGYYANSDKVALLSNVDASDFEVVDAESGKQVFKGKLHNNGYWDKSGENTKMADFSSVKKTGRYYIKSDSNRSYPFVIQPSGVYDELSVWVSKAFYLWRASTPIESKYATFHGIDYSRPMGHPDTLVYIHESADPNAYFIDRIVSSPKGWYDAGDYNKYVVNACYSVFYLGMAYEMNPEFFAKQSLNIPESGNGVPDILNELKWEYDWLITMQDPSDGGVFFKLSTLNFCRMTMPHNDRNDRFMIGKSTTSALMFAGAMAMASRLYAPYEAQFPGFCDKALAAAEKAYRWAENNSDIPYRNPQKVYTGEYSDDKFQDEFFLAASQLFLATKDKYYYTRMDFNQSFNSPNWHNVDAVGLMDLVLNVNSQPDFFEKSLVDEKFKVLADSLYGVYSMSAGKIALDKFEWGSNGDVAANGAILGMAYRLYGDKKFLSAALANFDYLLGRNPTDYCFVTMFGSKYTSNPHDRRASADGIREPLPGYLCGGPNNNRHQDCGSPSKYPTDEFPARGYLDRVCSYSTNEIANNWNAPLVMLTSFVVNQLDARAKKK